MIKKFFILIFIYGILIVFNLLIAKIIIFRNSKILFYRALMNNLTEISSALSLDESDTSAQKQLLTEFQTNDIRIANLKFFFRKYNSPLYDFAQSFVTAADKYQFDYRLLPAIAMQESNLCKYIYEGSHNCWGWGIYGNKVTRFTSYEEAIETISKGIKLYYIDKGLTTPEQIMKKYTPPSTGSWAHGVNTFLNVIE